METFVEMSVVVWCERQDSCMRRWLKRASGETESTRVVVEVRLQTSQEVSCELSVRKRFPCSSKELDFVIVNRNGVRVFAKSSKLVL